MENEIKGVYDLTELCRDVWNAVNNTSDNEPTADDLAEIRQIIAASYSAVAKRLGEGHKVILDGCGTFRLKYRNGKNVSDFNGGRYIMPDYFEVKFNAAPTMEDKVIEALQPVKLDVK